MSFVLSLQIGEKGLLSGSTIVVRVGKWNDIILTGFEQWDSLYGSLSVLLVIMILVAVCRTMTATLHQSTEGYKNTSEFESLIVFEYWLLIPLAGRIKYLQAE